jgi:ABC-type bacteriocin/lantibiotic exporter with double-glycine peptidase domain
MYWLIGIVLFWIAWTGVAIWARQAALEQLKGMKDNWVADGTLQQGTNFTCVPTSIVMLLKDENINTTTYDVAVVSDTDIRGTDGSGIVKAAEYFGFHTKKSKLTFEQFMDSNLPGILIFRRHGTRHAAYILPNVDPNMIQVKDPVDGLLFFSKAEAEDWFGSNEWEVYLFERGNNKSNGNQG